MNLPEWLVKAGCLVGRLIPIMHFLRTMPFHIYRILADLPVCHTFRQASRHCRLSIILISLLSVSIYAFRDAFTDELVLTVKTPLNNKIRCYIKGNSGEKILLIGCIHGNEKAGILLSVKVLNEIFAKKELKNTLILIPTLNPDGNILNTRANSNRIDINRNFPSTNWTYSDSSQLKPNKKDYWGGKSPASEIETKFILRVDSIFQPGAIIILHQFMDCVQYDGTGLRLAEFISKRSGQKLMDDIGYSTTGSIGSYFGDDKRKEVVTIEIPENPPDSLQQNLINVLIEVIEKGY